MSNPGDNGSWNPQGHDFDAQDPNAQPQQDPWAQPPAEQPSAAQSPYGQSDPYDHPADPDGRMTPHPAPPDHC